MSKILFNQIPECLTNGQCREIVIDGQVPIKWALPLYGYAMPIIVAITLATNSFIVVVLSRRHLKTPTNIVLLAMAVTELLTGFSSLPWLLYYYTFNGYKADRFVGLPSFWCTMFPYMASILPSIFHTAAIWLTVYLAVQRYIYICLPKFVRNHCTIKRSKQVIAIICIASIWIYAPDLFATYNQSYELYSLKTNQTRMVCLRVRTMFIEYIGNDIYYYSIYGLHTLLSHTLPCILLVIFTWKLIVAIQIADKRIQQTRRYTTTEIITPKTFIEYSSENPVNGDSSNNSFRRQFTKFNLKKSRSSTTESRRVQGLKQNTRMLIAVILLFLVTEIPAALIFSLHVSTVALRITFIQQHYATLNKLLIIRNVLIVVTYPLRFAIYCGMSQQFRECVSEMLMQHKFLSYCKKKLLNASATHIVRCNADSQQTNLLATQKKLCFNKAINNGKLKSKFHRRFSEDTMSTSIRVNSISNLGCNIERLTGSNPNKNNIKKDQYDKKY